MSSRQFALAYACDRDDPMSAEELRFRIDEATEHVDSVHRTEVTRTHVGDGRTGFVVWSAVKSGSSWPAAVRGQDEGAAWIHIPSAAGGPEDGVDPVRLARDFAHGARDRLEMGAPAAAMHWGPDGLGIVNDRLGMVRLYQFEVPGFGTVWSTRSGLAHIFSGLAPDIEQSTWSEIATLGWNMSGRSHLGNGRQMLASTSVHADSRGRVRVTSDRNEWIRATAAGNVPSYAEAAQGMVDAMSVVSWWKTRPAADLSGGKDSRVTAAAAIRAGVVDAVRTVNTDIGEVDTARELLSAAGNPVEHRVVESKPPKAPEGGVLSRYVSSQRAWEGGFNAVSAHRGAVFQGLLPTSTPIINGLGGEAIQGHTMATAASREQLVSQGAEAGQEWLKRLVRVNLSALDDDGAEPARDTIDAYADEARSLGFTTAFQVIDFFYHFSKMPYWSQPQVNPGVILPFYSPKSLPRTMWSLSNPSMEYGRSHRELLRSLQPAWVDVPFYKGSPKSRSIPWMWENDDWEDLRDIVRDGVGTLQSFSPAKVEKLIIEAESGEGKARHEIGLARVMWELSFRVFAKDIARASRRTADGAAAIQASTALY